MASAGHNFQVNNMRGKFQGTIAPTTPVKWRRKYRGLFLMTGWLLTRTTLSTHQEYARVHCTAPFSFSAMANVVRSELPQCWRWWQSWCYNSSCFNRTIHTNRLPLSHFGVHELRPACVMVEMSDNQRNICVTSFANGLPIVEGLHNAEREWIQHGEVRAIRIYTEFWQTPGFDFFRNVLFHHYPNNLEVVTLPWSKRKSSNLTRDHITKKIKKPGNLRVH